MRLLDAAELEASPTVANSAMNRERGLLGPNSYAGELLFDVLAFLKLRLQTGAPPRGWTSAAARAAR
jgi:hypothetical protein